MKKEILDNLDFIKTNVLKYGIIIAILTMFYIGFKKVWYWIVMPIMLFLSFRFFLNIANWEWVEKIDVRYLIILWIFVFSIFKKLGSLMFVK